MPPFRRQPGVVEVQPADHRPDIERRLYRVELELRSRDLRAVGNDGARHDRAEQLGAGRVLQRFQSAAQGIDQAVARGFISERAAQVGVEDVIGNIDQNLVRGGADVGNRCGHG
ncbi:hypothetical protein GALL_518450 [mine drainage metagenome]|uniref:Uncharacterized protein n=1 Tax=mine drainage metagenome TaxID=410659 RepID=A0A1J5P4U8_9ZZZZ